MQTYSFITLIFILDFSVDSDLQKSKLICICVNYV